MVNLYNHDKGISSYEQTEDQVVTTEPVVKNCIFITGGCFEVSTDSIRIIFWEEVPRMAGEEMRERRIVARLAMSKTTARDVLAALQEALALGGHVN